MDKFGVVSPKLKAMSKKVELPETVLITEQKGNEITDFMGMKIKNLTTPGERSATGMNSETGVLIIDVPAKSAFAGNLRPNDVILGFNGRPVTKIYELLEQQANAGRTKTVEVKVFRNQKEQLITVKLML
jgi:S1-C subfamily serine protease